MLGVRWEEEDTAVTRDGRKSTEHFARRDRPSHPTEIPGSRMSIRWGDQGGGRWKGGIVNHI